LLLPDYPYNQSEQYKGLYGRFYKPEEVYNKLYSIYGIKNEVVV